MAELILSKEETEMTIGQADEVILGKIVKQLAFSMKEMDVKDGFPKSLVIPAGALAMIDSAIQVNATELTASIGNLTIKDEHYGDWEVRIKQVKKSSVYPKTLNKQE